MVKGKIEIYLANQDWYKINKYLNNSRKFINRLVPEWKNASGNKPGVMAYLSHYQNSQDIASHFFHVTLHIFSLNNAFYCDHHLSGSRDPLSQHALWGELVEIKYYLGEVNIILQVRTSSNELSTNSLGTARHVSVGNTK